jgi:hypothetical protein
MAVQGDRIYLHGGRNNFVCDDMWMMSMTSLKWVEVKTVGRAPPPRHTHLMTCFVNRQKEVRLYLYGGTDELGGTAELHKDIPVIT